MTDRFEEIKELYELGNWPSNPNEAFELSEWLIAEVERLRRIEDAARAWDRAEVNDMEDACDTLSEAIDQSWRPGTEFRTERR